MKKKIIGIFVCTILIISIFGSGVISATTKTDRNETNLINNNDETDIKNHCRAYTMKEESTCIDNDDFGRKVALSNGDLPVNTPKWKYDTDSEIEKVSISADGKYIAVGSGSKVHLFHKNSDEPEWSFDTGHLVDSVSISGNGEYIAAGNHESKKGYVYRFDKNSSDPKLQYQIEAGQHGQFISVSVSISADGEYLAAGTEEFELDASSGRVFCFHKGNNSPKWSCHHMFGITSISNGGEYITVGAKGSGMFIGSSVLLFHKDSGFIWEYRINEKNPFYVSISADGNYIAAGNYCGEVYLFHRDNSTPVWSYDTGHLVDSVSISGNGEYIAAGGSKIYLFHRDNSTPVWSYDTGAVVTSVSISADNDFITAGDSAGYVYFFYEDNNNSIPLWHSDNPPEKPSRPSGQTLGKKGEEYTYTSSTTDPDGDQIYYWFDWGDGTNSGWVGPYNSGQTGSANHIWGKTGKYEIKVKAKDIYGAESEWSDPLPVIMPKNQNSMIQKIGNIVNLLQRILQTPKQRVPSQANLNNEMTLTNTGINPISFSDSSINSVSISADGEYIVAGCSDENVYFFHSWDDLIDDVIDNNTYQNIIPNVYSIIHDPSGDSSYSYLRKAVTNTIGFSLGFEVGRSIGFETVGDLFGAGTEASLIVGMSYSKSRDIFITYTTEEHISTSGGGPKYAIGPGYGDVYWIEEWKIPYQLVNRSFVLKDEIFFNLPFFKFGVIRNNSKTVTADWINKNVEEPMRSDLLSLDIGYDNHIGAYEQNLVYPPQGNPEFFITYTSKGITKTISTYTSVTRTVNFFVEIFAAEELELDYEVIEGKAKLTTTIDFGATGTAKSTNETSWTYAFQLEDNSQCSDSGYDELSVRYYEDKVFGTFLILTEENTSKTSQPHEYWTQKSDTTLPYVDITNPSNGQQVQGTVYVQVEISDNDNYFDYQILIDGAPKYNISTDETTIIWPWDTTYYSNGSHTIKAKVTDTSGNTGMDEVTVIVNN